MPIVYTLCILFIRLSILFFYRRLFGPNRNLQRIVSAFVWYEAIYTTVITLGCIFICNPVNSWWDLSRRADDCPTFRRTMGLYVGVRSLGVLEDVLILLLPMKFVFGLKLPLREKVGLCLIFSLGALYASSSLLLKSALRNLTWKLQSMHNSRTKAKPSPQLYPPTRRLLEYILYFNLRPSRTMHRHNRRQHPRAHSPTPPSFSRAPGYAPNVRIRTNALDHRVAVLGAQPPGGIPFFKVCV